MRHLRDGCAIENLERRGDYTVETSAHCQVCQDFDLVGEGTGYPDAGKFRVVKAGQHGHTYHLRWSVYLLCGIRRSTEHGHSTGGMYRQHPCAKPGRCEHCFRHHRRDVQTQKLTITIRVPYSTMGFVLCPAA